MMMMIVVVYLPYLDSKRKRKVRKGRKTDKVPEDLLTAAAADIAVGTVDVDPDETVIEDRLQLP